MIPDSVPIPLDLHPNVFVVFLRGPQCAARWPVPSLTCQTSPPYQQHSSPGGTDNPDPRDVGWIHILYIICIYIHNNYHIDSISIYEIAYMYIYTSPVVYMISSLESIWEGIPWARGVSHGFSCILLEWMYRLDSIGSWKLWSGYDWIFNTYIYIYIIYIIYTHIIYIYIHSIYILYIYIYITIFSDIYIGLRQDRIKVAYLCSAATHLNHRLVSSTMPQNTFRGQIIQQS